MCITHGVTYAYTTSCFGRHEAHSGDSVGYSRVSRTDALQSLLSDETHDSHAQHPHYWPDRSTCHRNVDLIRGAL
jgi:hypothetical protein